MTPQHGHLTRRLLKQYLCMISIIKSTDGNKTGYIIVDKLSGTPSVSAFGYDEAFFTANGIPDMQASRTKILCFDTFNMAYKNGIHRQLFIRYEYICIIMIILALI